MTQGALNLKIKRSEGHNENRGGVGKIGLRNQKRNEEEGLAGSSGTGGETGSLRKITLYAREHGRQSSETHRPAADRDHTHILPGRKL